MYLDKLRLDGRTAFITGGGYKYCQLGEGNCFLRVPPGCRRAMRIWRIVGRVGMLRLAVMLI